MLKRIHRVVFALRSNVCGMGFLGAVKCSEVNAPPIHFNLRLPLSRPKLPCPDQARFTIASYRPLVLAIFRGRNISQVCNSVVITNSVNVVNVAFGPSAVYVKPSEPMRAILPPFDAYASVALRGRNKACFGPCFGKLIARGAIGENARFGVIVQKLFKPFLGECMLGFSHVIAPFQRWIGQRIEGVTSTFFPRFNIGGIA